MIYAFNSFIFCGRDFFSPESVTKRWLISLTIEYVIKIGDITIKPLWVEAYYSDTNTGFVDEAVHGNECQKNQYGSFRVF